MEFKWITFSGEANCVKDCDMGTSNMMVESSNSSSELSMSFGISKSSLCSSLIFLSFFEGEYDAFVLVTVEEEEEDVVETLEKACLISWEPPAVP
ncbi:hypothetical protein WICPIJ_005019 [Wickerhamomyces pijperi]|uniref:Uncharacterized protein n=1 Tax=Wickerhamomyces pijperi TaxID=599730 RepID=A0A9P8Q4N7_WICPI|nr:hypothetical protein WICPIJ_005019 [Wickerhamomyces pijperi]